MADSRRELVGQLHDTVRPGELASDQVAAHLGDGVQTLVNVYAHELDTPERQRVVAGAIQRIYG